MIITTGRCHLLLTGERFLGLWLAALGEPVREVHRMTSPDDTSMAESSLAYPRRAGVLGQPRPHSGYATFHGRIRSSADSLGCRTPGVK
jgi:hypothetical protein